MPVKLWEARRTGFLPALNGGAFSEPLRPFCRNAAKGRH
jgi:hypothetical protein